MTHPKDAPKAAHSEGEGERVADYVREYEFRGDGGDYTPNERERLLIEDALHGWISRDEASKSPLHDLVARLLSSATALRENTVYTGDGDPVRLLVQADEMAEAAAALRASPAPVGGMVSVPVTDRMAKRGGEYLMDSRQKNVDLLATGMFEAMIAAAPSPSQGELVTREMVTAVFKTHGLEGFDDLEAAILALLARTGASQ